MGPLPTFARMFIRNRRPEKKGGNRDLFVFSAQRVGGPERAAHASGCMRGLGWVNIQPRR